MSEYAPICAKYLHTSHFFRDFPLQKQTELGIYLIVLLLCADSHNLSLFICVNSFNSVLCNVYETWIYNFGYQKSEYRYSLIYNGIMAW